MALGSTIQQPLPSLWIWLLRIKNMNDIQLNKFLLGQVEITMENEQNAWSIIRETLTDHLLWYDTYNQSNKIDTNIDTQTNMTMATTTPAHVAQNVRNKVHKILKAAILSLPPVS